MIKISLIKKLSYSSDLSRLQPGRRMSEANAANDSKIFFDFCLSVGAYIFLYS